MSTEDFNSFLSNMILTKVQKKEVYNRFCNQIELGLKKSGNADAEVKCYVTYVQELPTGEERGIYLALDLGGTNFRVLCITLNGPAPDKMEFKSYVLAEDIITGTADQLFDYVATCVQEFTTEHHLNQKELALGFTFSFPCFQKGLSTSILARWTKSFTVSGVVGEDIGELLQKAFDRQGVKNVKCVAIINDTTGTLMSCAHRNKDCRLGVIIGTGCNGCFVEPVENVELLEAHYKDKPHVIINAEWGAFGDKGSLDIVRTEYDQEIDKKSVNPGAQILEKMLSGLYLSDIVCLIVAKAMEQKLMLKAVVDTQSVKIKLETPQILTTHHLSKIEQDTPPDFTECQKIVRERLNGKVASYEDCEKLKSIVTVVAKRSADLLGINIAYLIARAAQPKVVVGIDGGIIRFQHNYSTYLEEAIKEALPNKERFEIMLSEDGSGRGAAIVASTAVANAQTSRRTQYEFCGCNEF